MKSIIMAIVIGSILLPGCNNSPDGQANELKLSENWKIAASSEVNASGEAISKKGFSVDNWNVAYVPSTVMGVLSGLPEYNRVLEATNYYNTDKTIFDGSWWYRTEFKLQQTGKTVLLKFDGLSYYANIWLNGQLVASRDSVLGSFRRFEFEVSNVVKKGTNVLAVEVFRQREGDFGLGFVDWNPRPLDENMGIWRDVWIKNIDHIELKNSFVRSKVNTETLEEAWLTIGTTIKNHSKQAINGSFHIKLEGNTIELPVQLAAGEEKEVIVSPEMAKELYISKPRLWWCNGLGNPELYDLSLGFVVDGSEAYAENITFGIREIESYFNETGQLGFKLNGKEILIKGAGWTDDIFLRDTHKSNETQVQYVKHMGLNTIRFETIWGTDRNIYELCDRYGILAMVGWSCQWEWENYLGKACDEFGGIITASDMELVLQYTRDQVLWLRNHPSIFVWLMGSDMLPRPELEKQYIELFNEIDDRPWLGAASKRVSELTGPTGVKMHGPYEYIGPSYWYIDKKFGGAYGFNTETGPGPQLPVKETIKKMLPDEKLWPLNPEWDKYCTTSAQAMNSMQLLNQIVTAMWGEPQNFDDFIIKSHLVNYEAMRGMFEAFRVNRPASTGIIQWMLNSAWPSFYWQLYDYFLVPTPAYYAAKKSLEQVQLHFDYGNRNIVLSNEGLQPINEATAMVSVFNIHSEKIFEDKIKLSINGNSVKTAAQLKQFKENVFLKLQLTDQHGSIIIDNFYWLSAQNEVFDWDKTFWVHTPMKKYANFNDLNSMEKAALTLNASIDGSVLTVEIENQSSNIAFFNELKLSNEKGEWLTPVFFSDNYFSLIPNEQKIITIILPSNVNNGLNISIRGWNTSETRDKIL